MEIGVGDAEGEMAAVMLKETTATTLKKTTTAVGGDAEGDGGEQRRSAVRQVETTTAVMQMRRREGRKKVESQLQEAKEGRVTMTRHSLILLQDTIITTTTTATATTSFLQPPLSISPLHTLNNTTFSVASARLLPWGRAHLNHTAQAFIISTVVGAAYFIVADTTVLKTARKNSFNSIDQP
ncbi:hypothetical protein OSB04_021225 [Centaurea solstitialis]|uniref:Uncharacterized protein n=1 Tax=Centaurea solstitialis TaxID=347529 RepID=A0AA38TC75_9ASTR|nr:hypothetical protein OSB04_021225 [Centaurea solstitialis]